MEARAATTPLRRAGTPADIAGVVAFLLSDDAGYVTGEVVSADGGATTVSTVRPSGAPVPGTPTRPTAEPTDDHDPHDLRMIMTLMTYG
jgi:hypothetical protein